MKTLFLFLLLIFNNYSGPKANNYKNVIPSQHVVSYDKKIKAVRDYEEKNIGRFLKGSFVSFPKGGIAYSVNNTTHFVDVVFCEFNVVFKDESGKTVGIVYGRADDIKAGEQVDPKNIHVFSLAPFGKTTCKFVFTKTIIEAK